MSDPISFSSSTPAIGLPLLIAGQAQKEFFVNQAMCLLDAMYMRAVIASVSAPPSNSNEGDCFRITSPATGAWSGRADQLAIRIGGDWHFVSPADGMQLFDRAIGQTLMFRSQWLLAVTPDLPLGGTVVDNEARAAIAGLLQALQTAGILNTDSP